MKRQVNIAEIIHNLLYSEFSTSTSYSAGDLCTYNSKLYKFTAAHKGAWNSSHATETTIDEIAADLQDQIWSVSSKLAPAFLTTTNYAKGDFCIYNGKLYKFTAAHKGAWNSSHATETIISEQFKIDQAYVANLATTVNNKANQSDLDDLETTVGNKANNSTVTALSNRLKANSKEFKVTYQDNKYGCEIDGKFYPFEKGSDEETFRNSLYTALQYSDLVTASMTFKDICDKLSSLYPAPLETYNIYSNGGILGKSKNGQGSQLEFTGPANIMPNVQLWEGHGDSWYCVIQTNHNYTGDDKDNYLFVWDPGKVATFALNEKLSFKGYSELKIKVSFKTGKSFAYPVLYSKINGISYADIDTSAIVLNWDTDDVNGVTVPFTVEKTFNISNYNGEYYIGFFCPNNSTIQAQMLLHQIQLIK